MYAWSFQMVAMVVSQCCGKAKVEAVASHTYYIWTTTSETGMRTPV